MKSRWIAAGAAALAIAVLTVPMLLGRTSRVEETEFTGQASCKPEGTANLDFTLKDMNGADVKLADYKGKVLLLNFWATWCGPCKVEVPALVEMQEKYRDKGFAVLGISIDDTAPELQAFASAYKTNYPLLLLKDEVDTAYGPLWAVPTTFFVDRSGAICRKHMGPVSKEQVEHEIRGLL